MVEKAYIYHHFRKIFKTPDYNVVEPKNDEPLIVEVKEATRIKGGQKVSVWCVRFIPLTHST